jgi:hypothetical protein
LFVSAVGDALGGGCSGVVVVAGPESIAMTVRCSRLDPTQTSAAVERFTSNSIARPTGTKTKMSTAVNTSIGMTLSEVH